MAGPQHKVAAFLSNLVVKRKSKDLSHSHKPIFCEAGKSLIICHGKSCHLYNTSTGNHIKQLFKCQNNIIYHQLHPLNESLVVAVTENGEVTVYNLQTHEVEHSTQLTINEEYLNRKKISKFDFEGKDEKEFEWNSDLLNSLDHRKFLHAETKVFQGNASKVFIWTSWCLNDEIQAHVSVFDLQSGKHKPAFSLRKSRLKKCQFNFVLSKSQELDIFVGLSNHCIHILQFREKDSYFYIAQKHYTGLNNTLTCLAIHPTEYCIATGDSIGRITLWRNIFDKHPLKEIFHWHSMLVRDLIFSNYGNYLFSGGEESVLVKWSLTSRKKQFLPRLSSAICCLSEGSDSSLLSILMSDSRILILDFNFHFVSTIQNFSKWCTLKDKKQLTIFTIDPRSDCIVLNGKTGHIQFLSIKEEGKLMYTFDVTDRNFIMSHSQKSVPNTEVTHAAFSLTGDWLVTAESRQEASCRESRLKFWKFLTEKASYALNTNVEFPHEGDGIYSLEISSDGVVATTGPDNKFRLWTLVDHQCGNVVKEIWSPYCDRKYRHNPCYALDFSRDGSLIAVTFSSILTIWETTACVLKSSLSSPISKEALRVCKFGNHQLTHLVVTGTDTTVCCWNTITLSLVWTVPLKLSILVSDPSSIYMAAFSLDRTLVVFSPASPAPDLLLKKVCRSPVVAARCGSNGSGRFCLFFLNSDQDLFCLGGAEKVDEAPPTGQEDPEDVTPYATQLPQLRPRPQEGTSFLPPKSTSRCAPELLASPAHTLSNPSLLCSQLLRSLLFSAGARRKGSLQGRPCDARIIAGDPPEAIPDLTARPTDDSILLAMVKTIFG